MRIVEWNKKLRTYLHDVGDLVLVQNPHDNFFVKAVVVEQVMPLEFPTEDLKPENLFYFPRTRTRGQTTRKESYLVKLRGDDPNQVYFWATKDCIRAELGNDNT